MKLIRLEWLKLSGHPFFWIGMGLYAILIVILLFSLGEFSFMGTQEREAGAMMFSNLKEAGVYKMPVLWHDITYLPTFLKFIPVFLLIFFVCNEYSFRTARQNVIDGLSRGQFFVSKIVTAFVISLLCTLLIIVFGLVLAFMHNEDLGLSDFFIGSDYLLAYFLEIFFMMAFALFLAVFLKRSAVVVIVILVYYFAEGIISFVVARYLPEGLNLYLPTQPSRELNLQPFSRLFNINGVSVDDLMQLDSPDQVSRKFMLVTTLYTFAFFAASFFIFKRKNI
jgi:ABC-2 type transport system permease protein